MPAGRFYVKEISAGSQMELPAEIAHQARDVLRLGAGDTIALLDGSGGVYTATLADVTHSRVLAYLGERTLSEAAEPPVRVVLCQGMLKAAKYEVVLQKCTELGVATFVPLLTERAVAASEEISNEKRNRWIRIVAEAMEQCGGTRLPQITLACSLEQAVANIPSGGIALAAWEGELTTTLRHALVQALKGSAFQDLTEIVLFIGPEGGFSISELELMKRHGVIPVTLGPRILRAETAAIAAVSVVQDIVQSVDNQNVSKHKGL